MSTKTISSFILTFFIIFYFSQEKNKLSEVTKIEMNKVYELNFKYNWNNMNRFDKNVIPDLEKIKSFLTENPKSIALISIKLNNFGNEKWHKSVTDGQKKNFEKELNNLNFDLDKTKIISNGNTYFKLGYNFTSNLDVYFIENEKINSLTENEVVNLYLSNFEKK